MNGPRTALLAAGMAMVLAAQGYAWGMQAAERTFRQNIAEDGTLLSAKVGGGGGVTVRAAHLACAGCHGGDAAGRTEGGVSAPAIDGFRLTKPWGHVFPDGRRRVAYDAAAFHKAVTSGIDPSGNSLDAAMPRYEISAAHSSALFSWLGKISSPGTVGVLRIGYPASAGMGEGVDAMRRMIDRVNAEGGIHGRKFELLGVEAGQSPPQLLAFLCPLPLAVHESRWSIGKDTLTIGCEVHADGAGTVSFGVLSSPSARVPVLERYAREILGVPSERIRVFPQADVAPPEDGGTGAGLPPLVIIAERLGNHIRDAVSDAARLGVRPRLLIAAGESVVASGSRAAPAGVHPEGMLAALPLPPDLASGRGVAARVGTSVVAVLLEAVARAGNDADPAGIAKQVARLSGLRIEGMPVLAFGPGRPHALSGIHLVALGGFHPIIPNPAAWWYDPER
jgi:hypothetical protein